MLFLKALITGATEGVHRLFVVRVFVFRVLQNQRFIIVIVDFGLELDLLAGLLKVDQGAGLAQRWLWTL